MTLTRFLENLLLRDIFSYLIPGALIIYFFISYNLDSGTVLPVLRNIKDIGGETGALFGFAGTSYVIGYLSSTLLFYLRDKLKIFKRGEIGAVKPEILEVMKDTFGEWVLTANLRYLAAICLHYVEIRKPDYYYEKIERRTAMRNFEIGISSVMLFLSVSQVISLPDWYKLFALLSFLFAVLLLRSSMNLEAAIDRITFITFYTVCLEELGKHQKADEEIANNANDNKKTRNRMRKVTQPSELKKSVS